MLKREIFKLFQLIEPYRIYDKDEDRFFGTIKIKEDVPSKVKEAYEKILQWQATASTKCQRLKWRAKSTRSVRLSRTKTPAMLHFEKVRVDIMA